MLDLLTRALFGCSAEDFESFGVLEATLKRLLPITRLEKVKADRVTACFRSFKNYKVSIHAIKRQEHDSTRRKSCQIEQTRHQEKSS